MHVCKNGKSFYKGTEPSPKGNGYCAKFEKIGTKKRGKNKKMWVVRSVKVEATGKRYKRWFQVPSKSEPVKKKKAERPLKRSSTAKSTKSKRPAPKTQSKKLRTLRGGKPLRQASKLNVHLQDRLGKNYYLEVKGTDRISFTLEELLREQGIFRFDSIRLIYKGHEAWSTKDEERRRWLWSELNKNYDLRERIRLIVENPGSLND